MRLAFGSANGGVEVVDSDDPETVRKAHPRLRRKGRRSCRRAFAWGIAMLFLGLSAGLMISSIVIGKPADPVASDTLEVLQFALFAGAVCALLILLADAGVDSTEARPATASTASLSTEERSPDLAECAEEGVSDRADHAEAPMEGAARSVEREVEPEDDGLRSGHDPLAPGRDSLAPLRESDAELLQRLVMSMDRYDIVCGRLARRFMLSPRQAEVFNLLARGRNASYIEDKLCISLSTAKSHISGVYRKLGVHTQQELLALVQNEIDETERK